MNVVDNYAKKISKKVLKNCQEQSFFTLIVIEIFYIYTDDTFTSQYP